MIASTEDEINRTARLGQRLEDLVVPKVQGERIRYPYRA